MGPICYGENHDEVFLGRDMGTNKVVSEVVAAQIDEEVKRIIDNAYERCEECFPPIARSWSAWRNI